MFEIFVSYRSVDARFGAAATYELLANRFDPDRIFLDNQSMKPGSIYPRRLLDALESTRVLLVLIGPEWLAGDPQSPGRYLIQREGDWVRQEIRRAFAREIPIVPTLLDGARLPSVDVLPEDIRQLVYCQTAEIRHQHLGADVDRLADTIIELLAPAVPAGPPGGTPGWLRVREADDPVPLGVHPSPLPAGSGTVAATGTSPRVPAYVPRAVADQLAWALSGTSFVLIVGDAMAGKSRLAYEVVRARLPEHWLVIPTGPAGLAEALALARHTDACVVWLDDIERYLGPEGLTVQQVSELTSRHAGHVVLLGTIRGQEHARLSPRWEARAVDEPGRLRSRLGRDVVRLAYEVHLSLRWTPAEIRQASISPDPRVARAARHALEFGIAEYLGAGPQLLAEWRDAWSPGNHPRGAAVVAAAVDAWRAGVRQGVSVDLLRRLHGRYLANRGGPALRPEPFDDALAWATETLHATSGLLVPAGRGRYQPFGYLADATDADPAHPAIPDGTWQLLITRMPAAECWHLGEAAYARRQLAFARSAFQRAAAGGNQAAELRFADCIGESGQRREALAALHGIIDARTRSAGPRHPAVLEARQALATWTGRTGDLQTAVHLMAEIVRELTGTVGATDPDTLTARHTLANWMGRAGRLADAVTEYRRLAQDRSLHDGPHHPHTLSAWHELANWLGRLGELDEALRTHKEVAAARTRVLGTDHPDTLRSRHRLTRLACEVEGTDVGLPLLAKVIADRERVLGPDHPHSLRSRFQYVRWMGKAGRLVEAFALAEQLTADSVRALGAAHPDTLRARHQHTRWTSEAGDHLRAAALLRDLIADWSRVLGPRHPYTLVSRYRLALAVAGTGARSEATTLLADLLADDVIALGAEHPYTIAARQLLAQWKAAW